MRGTLAILALAVGLAACTPDQPAGEQGAAPAASSGMSPWLSGALGFMAGNMLGRSSAAPAAAPMHSTTIINRTVVVKPATPALPAPAAPVTPKFSAPSVAPSRPSFSTPSFSRGYSTPSYSVRSGGRR
jgi:hypothetical protein